MAAVLEISISVPGDATTLTMKWPEWIRLSDGWQLGGWVDAAAAESFGPLWTTDRVMLTHPSEMPVFVSLRRYVDPNPRYYGERFYLKFQPRHAPRPHPAWTIDAQEAGK